MRDWTNEIEARLASLKLKPGREAEIVEELSAHLEQRYAELRTQGIDEAAAVALVREELLADEGLTERMRPLRQASSPPPVIAGAPRGDALADFWQDLRLATRMLRKQSALTLMVVLTLAIGVGANGALFALVDRVLLRDLPLPQPDRLVTIWERTETTPQSLASPLNMLDWARRSQSFEAMGGYLTGVFAMVLTTPEGAESVMRQWATAGIFDALGVQPVVGRTFLAADDAERIPSVVLSESYWRARFAADPDVVGQSLRLDGDLYTVVGVVPDQAEILGRANLWGLEFVQGTPERNRGRYPFQIVARLKPGVSLEAAQAEMTSIAADLAREYPTTNEGRSVALQPLRDSVLGAELKRTSILFLGIVGFVLLICFANIANLLLTRNSARGNELAIRSVLGADRRRLKRQFATENLLLAGAGGVAGLALAGALLRIAPAAIPQDLLPSGVVIAFDWRVAVFCVVATLVVALLFTLASSAQVAELTALREGVPSGRRLTDRSSRTRELLVVGQVATAVVLLYGAGLLTRTLIEVDGVDPGYRARSVLSLFVDPLGDRYPTPEALLQFYGAIEEELKSDPGVASAAWTSTLPLGPSMAGQLFYDVAGEPAIVPAERPTAEMQIVSPGYFRTLDLPILAGRAFDDGDRPGAMPVCIVNEAFVARRLGGGEAVGRTVQTWQAEESTAEPRTCEVVGVATSSKRRADEPEVPSQIYYPFARIPNDDIFLIVRPVSGDAGVLASSVRAAIARVDRESLVSVTDIATLESVARDATARYRFRALLIGAFAGLALLLAALGVFGVLAYTVQRRWREYGVRMALGARPEAVVRLIARGAARLLIPGVLVGALLALVAGQLLGAMLFGVRPFDAATFTLVLVALAVTAALSVAGPALRATRIDPVGALRSE
jgi:putative ABC transport system permease protein